MLLITMRGSRRKEVIPFGPFIAASAMISLLWGGTILSWYLAQFAILQMAIRKSLTLPLHVVY